MSAVLAAVILSSGLSRGSLWIRMLIGGAVTLALTAIFAWKLLPEWPYFYAVAAGVVTFAIVAWLGGLSDKSGKAAAAVAILTAAFAAVGFKLLAGFGIGIGVTAACVLMIPAAASKLRQETEESCDAAIFDWLCGALYVGAAIVLLRLFIENYASEIRGVDMRVHYTFVALAIGAMLPFLLAAVIPAAGRKCMLCKATGAAAIGLVAAAVPLIATAVWGFKAALGFVIGTIIAQMFVLLDGGALHENAKRAAAVVIAAAQVSAAILCGVIAPLSEATRAQKAWMIGVVVALGMIWGIIDWLINRRSAVEEG